MRFLRRRIRGFFALQAIILLAAVVRGATDQTFVDRGVSPLRHFGVLTGFTAMGLLFAAAYWTTRKPSPYRNPWAIAASVISIAAGGSLVWFVRSNVSYATPALIVIALGVGGLYIYGQGASPAKAGEAKLPEPVVAPRVRRPIAGDRTSPWINHLVTAVSVVAEFSAIYLWSIWARSHGLLHHGRMPWFVLFTVAVLITTVLHECGHALVAWCFEMKLLSFNAGPIQLRKREGKWHFKFDPEGFFNLGGSVRVVPTNLKQPSVHDLWMIAAGPVANIYFGALFLWAVLSIEWPYYEQTWRLVAFTASFCFIAAITNLLPFMTEDGGYSDGARILQILTHSPLDDYHRLMNTLASTLVTQRRYRDLDIEAIERNAEHFWQDVRGVNLRLCAVNFYIDSGSIREARLALAKAEATCINSSIDLPAPLHTAFVIGQAYLNHDAAAARRWWDQMEAKKPERKNVDYWLAQTALCLVEGRVEDSREAWQKADAEAQKLPAFGAYDFDRYRCSLLRQELDNPAQARHVPVATRVRIAPAAPARVPSRAAAPAVAMVAQTTGADGAAIQGQPAENTRWDPLQFIRNQATLDRLGS